MRRALASLILGLSLVLATVAWSGFVMLHTVLDPGRSERLADEMLDNTVLRGVIVDAVADSLQSAVPAGVEVPRDQLEAAATAALDDPRAEALVRDGIVRIHRNALEGVEEPVTLDAAAFGAAARDSLVAARPELAPVLPPAPSVAVTLPDAGLSFLGRVRDLLERAVMTAALVALAGAVFALVIARDRPGVLRRVSLWAFAASAFWLLLGYGLPWLAEQLAPASAAVFAAAVEVFLGAMIPPALGLAGFGVALIVVSLVWDALRRSVGARGPRYEPEHAPRHVPPQAVPARAAQAGQLAPAGQGPQAGPWQHRTQAVSGSTLASDPTSAWLAPASSPDPWDLTRPEAPPPASWPPPGDPWSSTRPEPGPVPGPGRGPSGPGTRWVEGVGYVEE